MRIFSVEFDGAAEMCGLLRQMVRDARENSKGHCHVSCQCVWCRGARKMAEAADIMREAAYVQDANKRQVERQ